VVLQRDRETIFAVHKRVTRQWDGNLREATTMYRCFSFLGGGGEGLKRMMQEHVWHLRLSSSWANCSGCILLKMKGGLGPAAG